MGKSNMYYLIARNKKTNSFNIIDVGNSLEEIDLYTINFDNKTQLVKQLVSEGKIDDSDVDTYIVVPKKDNGKNYLNYMDILYSDSSGIKDISIGFKNKNIPTILVDETLNYFCFNMQHDSRFYDMVMLGKTNLYKKFTDYFEGRRYDIFYDVKYRDGLWTQKSYPLIRNIYDAFSKYNSSYKKDVTDQMYRSVIEDKILFKIDNNNCDNQMNLFDFPIFREDNFTNDDKLLEIITMIDNLDKEVFVYTDNKIIVSRDKFSKMNEERFNYFSNLLDRRLITCIYYYLEHKKLYESISNNDSINSNYEKLVNSDQRSIFAILKNKNVLDDAYSFIKVYNKYILGEEYGKQKRKGE